MMTDLSGACRMFGTTELMWQQATNAANEEYRRCRIGKVTNKPLFRDGYFANRLHEIELGKFDQWLQHDYERPPVIPRHGVLM